MTQEDIKWLKQFEPNFKTAINSNYSRNILDSQLRKMVEIYETVKGKKYNLCYHCSSSILGFLKDMGKIYFEVQAGNEPDVNINELEESVTEMESNTNESTTTNTNKGKKSMRNAKHTTKQIK